MLERPLSLLLIDDDPVALERLGVIVAQAFPAARFESFGDPLAALARSDAAAFDCVVVDDEMPGLGGLEFTHRLRAAWPHIPVVLCTAAEDEPLAEKPTHSGVTDHIPKSAIAVGSISRAVRRAVELARKARQVADQRQELETFAFAIAHDFKQPLRQIITFSDIAADDIARGDVSEASQHLAYMKAAAKRLSNLVDVMSQYALIGEAPALSVVRISEAVDAALAVARAYLDARAATIVLRGDGLVKANPALLRQILHNLIVNGVTYNTSERPTVRVEVGTEGQWRTIALRDNGIGISPEFTEQIFQPLARLHNAAQYPGAGLGLTLARKAAAVQHGSIACRPQAGEGSEFLVKLPAADG